MWIGIHVGLRGEDVEKSHGFINLATKRTDASLPVRPPVTRAPARCCVYLSSYPPEFRKRPVQREVTDQIVHRVRHTLLFVQVCCIYFRERATRFLSLYRIYDLCRCGSVAAGLRSPSSSNCVTPRSQKRIEWS